MKVERQYLLIKNLNRLLQKGYALKEALNLIQSLKPKLIGQMTYMIEKGELLSTVFKKLHFKNFVYETLRVGEKSNKIMDVMTLIENQFHFYLSLKKEMNKVLLYPFLLFFFSMICFEFIRIQLYPVITNLLNEFSIKNNNGLLFLAFHSLEFIFSFLVILFILVTLFKPLSNFLPYMKTYRSLNFARHLVLLLTCGNSLEEGLQIIKESFSETIYSIEQFETFLLENKPLSIFSPYTKSFIRYFKLGIKSNDLLKTLEDFHVVYDEILLTRLSTMTYYIQVALFTLLSVNLFIIYYLIMIPLLHITNKM